MPRRRELKGITINFAKLLSGRNNDYLGYWAVGQLFLLAQENNVESITLYLLALRNSLHSPQVFEMCQQMKAQLERLLKAQKTPLEWVKSVSVEFSFNQEYQEKFHYWRSALGKHYLVAVEIETDLGYINKALEGGNVNPHDPTKEHRSNRLLTSH
ncbi:hypothetical protein tinsulaeT_00390 [Thalassotalea insulae]|uniref:Uncharacterized protein n=1 Tax=Thalassotalea insulae TaxID=2056778 RepID=A0ABQ6GMZ5_9GAMM|nr:hypothetical protein [Thalassotalea insulae]GLX76699.1 hypothetical protein tinsulaeT_00390 [Thalassotalea insulae]